MHKRIPLILTLAFLASCTTTGPDFVPPQAPAVGTYAMPGDGAGPDGVRLTPEASMDASWWKAFGSAHLDALVEQALAYSPTLDSANAALARAQALESVQRGGALPKVDATGSVSLERINTAGFGITGFPSPTINLYSLGSDVSFDLDLFGGQKRRIEQAAAKTEAQAYRTSAAYLTLTGQVVSRVIELAALRAELTELDDMIAGDQKTLQMIQRGVEAGGEPRSATNTSDAQLAEDEARRPPLLYQIAITRHALALLVGKAPAEWRAPDIELADIAVPADFPLSLPSTLVRQRPDIRAAEADLHAATAAIGIAEAGRYPNVSLDAAFAFTALSPDDLFQYDSSGWSAGPSITAPLFHGGSLKARQAAAVAEARKADAAYRQTVLSAFVQVADLLSAISRDQQLIAAQTRASDIAVENARLASISFENGAGSLLSVIDAQRQAQRARFGLVDSQARLRSDLAALYVATGPLPADAY
tara:strand:+ start:4973 stop:6400 length:1428 start_codon:yes stop_codon:yes gene_type:complete